MPLRGILGLTGRGLTIPSFTILAERACCLVTHKRVRIVQRRAIRFRVDAHALRYPPVHANSCALLSVQTRPGS